MISNFFKTYLRTLWRNKIYSSINTIGLSIAMACAMLIILYANDEASYDRFHENGRNIFRVVHNRVNPDGSIENTGGNSGYLQGPVFHSHLPEIETFVRLKSYNLEVKQGNEIFSREVHFADPEFFQVFSFPLVNGSAATVLTQPNSLVISEAMAKKAFGTLDVLGKTLQIKQNDKYEWYSITGVAKDAPDNSSIKFEMVTPLKVPPEDEFWGNYFLNTFVVLAPGTDITAFQGKMKAVYEKEAKDAILEMSEKYGVKTSIVHLLQPFSGIHLSKEYPADNGMFNGSSSLYTYILSAIAFFILLIACINFVNLTIARSIKRAREIGIRKVVGGGKNQLVAQFLTESYLMCASAFAISIVLVQSALPSFNELSNKILHLAYLLEIRIMGGYVGLFIVTGLLAGLYPSLVLSSFNPVRALKNNFSTGGSGLMLKGLVIFQFALATLLMIGTITIFLQFDYLTTQPLGYDDQNVVVIPKSGLKHSEARLLKRELMKSPDIVEVAVKNGGREGTMARINGDKETGFDYQTIDNTYLSLFKIPVVKGRNFSPDFPSDSNHAVLVNETFVKEAGWNDPIGQELNFWYRNDKYSVIGVVKDHHFLSLNRESGALVLTMRTAKDYGMALVRINPARKAASLEFIGRTFKRLFPESLYEYKFKDEENVKSYAAEARWKKIMLSGAAVTIFLSCIGLFGLSVMAAEKRTKEIGIRKVLGASVAAAVSTLTKDFLKLVSISMVIAIPVSWLLTDKWLQNYPYHVYLGWTVFAGGGLMMIVISLATVSFQALKTALSNPVDALRTE